MIRKNNNYNKKKRIIIARKRTIITRKSTRLARRERKGLNSAFYNTVNRP